MNRKIITSQKGFSLVELMVVVAIIGILAAMSVGQVQKQIAKARQAEAKTNLASYYGAQKAFQAEWSSYCSTFQVIGLGYEGQLRYSIGVAGDPWPAASVSGYTVAAPAGPLSMAASGGTCPGNCTVIDSNGAAPTDPGGSVDATSFTAEAHAMIFVPSGGTGTEDQWSIDHAKNLLNSQAGIQ